MTTLIIKLFLYAFKRLFVLFVTGAISAAAVIHMQAKAGRSIQTGLVSLTSINAQLWKIDK
ncbi:MAG: hypothetical protein SGI74_10625 [Oligoflexia bacterium]|nr:hypothetical protein [Oligoflexia bacterium]